MANLLNVAGSDTEETAGIEIRSEGQRLLDRQLDVRNRFRDVYRKLGAVRANIQDTRRIDGAAGGTSDPGSKTKTAFFGAMSLLTDEFETIAAQLEESIADLETLF